MTLTSDNSQDSLNLNQTQNQDANYIPFMRLFNPNGASVILIPEKFLVEAQNKGIHTRNLVTNPYYSQFCVECNVPIEKVKDITIYKDKLSTPGYL